MIYISSNIHRRGGSLCPVSGLDLGTIGSVEDSRWHMHQDGRQLSDVAAGELDPAMFALLGQLRERLPTAQLWIAIVRRDDIPIPLTVCNFDVDSAQCCHAVPQPREFEISFVIPGDCAPKTRCPRCLATLQQFVGVDSVLRSHFNTAPLEPISPPPPPPEPTAAEIAVTKRQAAVDSISKVLCAVATNSRTLPPREAAEILVKSVETIVELIMDKEPK